MKHAIAFAALIAAASPAASEEQGFERGFNLLEEGTALLLRELMKEVEPALNGLRDSLSGFEGYHAPEVLPNGDIIIRRKTPLDVAPQGEIEI